MISVLIKKDSDIRRKSKSKFTNGGWDSVNF